MNETRVQDHPALYRTSDAAALLAQKRYFLLVRIKIIILVITALIAAIAWNRWPETRTMAAIVIAVILTIVTLLSLLMDLRKFDHSWFVCRAIAESVKTETWKYMMCVEPYTSTTHNDDRFLSRLREILSRQRSVPPELSEQEVARGQITDTMREVRSKSRKNRRAFYSKHRIEDQLCWYARKARWNQRRELLWFVVGWVLQGLAIVSAVFLIAFGDFLFNPVGVFTTTTAGTLSWYHARSYRELSQSYGLVAQELGMFQDQVKSATTEAKLADTVIEVEHTISREHTIWLAKRLGMPEL